MALGVGLPGAREGVRLGSVGTSVPASAFSVQLAREPAPGPGAHRSAADEIVDGGKAEAERSGSQARSAGNRVRAGSSASAGAAPGSSSPRPSRGRSRRSHGRTHSLHHPRRGPTHRHRRLRSHLLRRPSRLLRRHLRSSRPVQERARATRTTFTPARLGNRRRRARRESRRCPPPSRGQQELADSFQTFRTNSYEAVRPRLGPCREYRSAPNRADVGLSARRSCEQPNSSDEIARGSTEPSRSSTRGALRPRKAAAISARCSP